MEKDFLYQVQFKRDNQDDNCWTAFNVPNSKFDVVHTLAAAKEVLISAVKYHTTGYADRNYKYEYRICKMYVEWEVIA